MENKEIMKKYIRTENGIYQFKNNENICKKDNELFEIQRFFQPVDHINYKLLGKIKAEADTIEDLCDRFVFEYKKYDENGKIICRFWREYLFMEVALETFDDCKIKDKVIYGAIITDKGLIYVAKMNDEGDLLLL